MTEYLSAFARTLDDFFKGLSDCGLMTSYTVQLQSNLTGLEAIINFRALIQSLVQSLQSLLSRMPSMHSTEVSTQTMDNSTEVVVTCHPISLAEFTNAQIIQSSIKDSKVYDNNTRKRKKQQEVVSSLEICELNPLLIETNKKASELVKVYSKTKEGVGKTKVENIVHIVVRAPNNIAKECDDQNKESKMLDQHNCKECDMIFETQVELKEHLMKQHSLHNHVQTCNMCKKVFNSVQSLQEHCHKEHSRAGSFVCNICRKSFMTKLSHNRHMYTHEGKKEAVCKICGKAFSRADYLQTHYSIHLGKRSYACSQCPRTFVRRVHLTAHEKIHSGVKDHLCEVCNKGFTRKDKLKEHMMRHLNIKRFHCKFCQRDYAEKRNLKVHLKSHTNEPM